MIYIRTDANDVIATGHVMRCLTIADEMVRMGNRVCFVVSDKQSLPLIKERNFKAIVLETRWDDIDKKKEFFLLKNFMKKDDWLLVDSYGIDNDYLKVFQAICKIAVFDDLFYEKKNADIIINYNVFYKKFDYKSRYQNSKCCLLLGEKYVPLRRQFQEVKPLDKARKVEHLNVLLMCGGGDKNNFICSQLKYIYKNSRKLFDDINWKVVIGKYYLYEAELYNFEADVNNIEIHKNVKNMACLMKDCDLCITAASTVLYECAIMLLPTLFCIVAEDQIYDAEGFAENGRMIYCGNYLENRGCAGENILNALRLLVESIEQRQVLKDKMREFIDADGAKRIAEAFRSK